jgi:hypothetical protein
MALTLSSPWAKTEGSELVQRTEAREAKAWLVDRLAAEHIVNGIGLARNKDDWVVKVNLSRDDSTFRESIPAEVLGVQVVVEVVGEVVPRPSRD